MKPGTTFLCVCVAATAFAVVALGEDDGEFTDRFSKASCNFTLNLLKQVASKYKTSNIIFSPASITIILSVLQQGAKENTAAQLEKVLHLSPEDSVKGHANLPSLKEEKNVTLEWGNRCYIKPGFDFEEDFKTTVKNSFDVGVEEMDFGVPSPEDSARRINSWVSDTTHGLIQNLVEPGSLTVETVMVLINAIFFKGNWASPFKKGKTAEDKFELSSEESIQSLFMSQRGRFYADKDSVLGAKWVKLSFQNPRFAMIFVLPTKKHRLGHLIEKLTDQDLYEIFNSRGVSQVKLRIPKFKLSEKVSLVESLQQLGLTDIFSEASDLSGISTKMGNLQVSEIIHEANVEIDEKGSTASAATVVTFLRMRTPNLSFIADQPFLFFIIDTNTSVPLFAGKVANPKK